MWSTAHRPAKFKQLIGQPVAVGVLSGVLLKYAQDPKSLPSCMKFYGQSGCGKTTAARLEALYLNCESGPRKACGTCDSCVALFEDRHPDVIEVDAATYNTDSDVAQLLEQLTYSIQYRVRVIIFDECHLLTKSAWASLLKVIEEAPDNVLFIFCTTEVNKIPKAIMGRGFNLEFNHISDQAVAERLADVVEVESLPAVDPEILTFIARKSSGHMRNAINYLETCYLLSRADTITIDHAAMAVGMTPEEILKPVLTALLSKDLTSLLSSLTQVSKWTPRVVCQSLIDFLELEIHRRQSQQAPRYSGSDIEVVELMNLLQQNLVHFKITEINIYWLVLVYYMLWDIKTIVIR